MQTEVIDHYIKNWRRQPTLHSWQEGPVDKLPPGFKVLAFEPDQHRNMWTYATCGLSSVATRHPIELHLFSSKEDYRLVELLTALAYYHHNIAPLDLHHTVNFGRPWQDQSACDYGFISLPYLDGLDLEDQYCASGEWIKCYWLIPVTAQEVAYKEEHGTDALEAIFDQGFDYLNVNRACLV